MVKQTELNDVDLRALAHIESHIMKEQITSPYINADWYIYFNHSVIGFHFFDVFLSNYAKGEGTRFNDLIANWKISGLRSRGYSREAIKKKLADGVHLGVLKRYVDEEDARVAIYQINSKHREDLAKHILLIQENRVRALMDGNRNLTRNLMNRWKEFFVKQFDADIDNEAVEIFLNWYK